MSLLVLLDLSAAFDTVDQQILLSVLENRFSMDSTALRWFESYLTDRVQSFSYAGVQTPMVSKSTAAYVPHQGSVLGPRCFISYRPTEDIVNVLQRHTVRSHLYADDTQFYDGC